MPECYEVKRIADYLIGNGLVNQRLGSIRFMNSGNRILSGIEEVSLSNKLINSQLQSIQVKAKYTGFTFSSGTVIMHYRFTGIPHLRNIDYGNALHSIYSLPITTKKEEHCRFVWQFDNHQLEFYDTRCLSKLYFYQNYQFEETPQYQSLAPDLRQGQFLSYTEFKDDTRRLSMNIKTWLLDQTRSPSGIGNYLACEILFLAKLNPFIKVHHISHRQYNRLIQSFLTVHRYAEKNTDYHWFNIFNRSHCRQCRGKVEKKKHLRYSQTTHFCPICQLV